MKRLGAMLFCLLAATADAETVIVRSGEHDTFSRLVLPLAEPSSWRFGSNGNGYALELGRPGVALDLGDVYRLIPRTRLAELSYDLQSHRLNLRLACECHATAFAPNGTAIAIDIVDGLPPENSKFEQPLDPVLAEAGPVFEAAGTSFAPETWAHPVAAQNTAMLGFFWKNNIPDLTRAGSPAAVALPDGPEQAAPPLLEMSPGLQGAADTDLRKGFVEQLGRAATQGLVVPVQDRVLSAPEIAEAARISPVEKPTAIAVDAASGVSQLRIRTDTAFDRDAGMSAPPNETHGGKACLSDDALDLNGWGQAEQAADQIARMNRALVGEFDVPDPVTVAALSRYYLMLGWGAEAKAVIHEFPTEELQDAVLLAMAEIMDNGSTDSQVLAGMESCPGNAAFWSVLSRPTLTQGTDVNRPAVLGAFSRLPLHLRRHLLPEITRRFLGSGDNDTAQALRDTVSRAAGNHGMPLKVAEAEIGLHTGDQAQAETMLADVVAADGADAPEALVKLVELRVGQGDRIDMGTVAAVDALAYEHRGTELGTRLSTAHVQAAAANGALDAAFAAWDRLDPAKLSEADGARIANAIGRGMIAEPDATTFLRLSFAHLGRLMPTPMSPEFRAGLAERLLDLGFPREARAVLSGGGAQQHNLIAAHLLARSYLADGDAAAAIQTLQAHHDEKSLELHAQALASLGNNRGAADLLSGASNVESHAAYDWRAGNWAAVMKQGEGPRPAAAALMSLTENLPSESVEANTAAEVSGSAGKESDSGDLGQLARAAATIAESRKARETLRALLEDSRVAE